MDDIKKIRVLLADDHPLIRTGIKSTLEHENDILVVAEANNGDEVLDLCKKHNINILILDIRMPGPPTREIISEIHLNHPAISILILSAFDDDVYVRTLSSMGINGYVLKDEAIEKLVEAVHTVYQGSTWYSQKIIKKLLNFSHMDKQFVPSEREIEILKLVKQGLTYEEISQKLSITQRTVRFHVSNIQDKLDAKNRIEALSKAVEKGWLE